MKTKLKYFRVDRRQISFLKFIVEAYDGMALVRTVDAHSGRIALHVAPGCEADVAMLIEDLGRHIIIESEEGQGLEVDRQQR